VITPLPPNTSGADLVLAINDRIRQINIALPMPAVPPAAIVPVGGAAGAAYTAVEQTLLNQLKAAVNALIARGKT
jgi:hypothetical protein